MNQRFERTIKKPEQRGMKKIGQKDKQEQKREGMGRSSQSNFLKRKVLPTTVKKRRNWVKKKKGKS